VPRPRAAYREYMVKALLALIPSVGVLFLFVIVLKAMLEGDRRERAAQARLEREQDERLRRSSGTDSSGAGR
jgi:hypothetical protein